MGTRTTNDAAFDRLTALSEDEQIVEMKRLMQNRGTEILIDDRFTEWLTLHADRIVEIYLPKEK